MQSFFGQGEASTESYDIASSSNKKESAFERERSKMERAVLSFFWLHIDFIMPQSYHASVV